jgi:hypothetical protein
MENSDFEKIPLQNTKFRFLSYFFISNFEQSYEQLDAQNSVRIFVQSFRKSFGVYL